MSKIIGGSAVPGIPWQERPVGCKDVLWRYSENPIVDWNPTAKSARVFNSAVVPYGDGFIGVFRSDHKNGTPQLHVGVSKDGLDWEIEDEEIHWKDEDGKDYQPVYAYDPRVVHIEGSYYIVWCTDFGGPALALGKTTDFKQFIRLPNICTPFNRNGVLFPRKINGNFVLLNRPSDNGHTPFGDIYISESPDLIYWGKHRKVMSVSPENWWQSQKIGPGATPIETDEGWLVFYHGVVNTCNGYVYSIGAALLDAKEPSIVLKRAKDYLLAPEKVYETTGFVPNVCFPCATVCDAETGRIVIYYGAADTYIAVAFTTLEDVLQRLECNNYLAAGDREYIR